MAHSKELLIENEKLSVELKIILETNSQLDINNKQLRENLHRNQIEFQETKNKLEQGRR